MKSNRTISLKLLSLIVFLFISINTLQAQEYSLLNEKSTLKVLGTSSLHDWVIEAEQQSGSIIFKNLETPEIKTISLSVVAESLKSGKSTMDKNTYKALKTDDYKNITFKLSQVKSITKKESNVYAVSADGRLSIAGTEKQIDMNFTLTLSSNDVKLNGSKTFKMTDFNVDPPKALFGTITTVDEVTIEFSSLFK